MKQCNECHEIKDESEFQKYYVIDKIYTGKRYEYLRNKCKICLAKKCRKWRFDNPEKIDIRTPLGRVNKNLRDLGSYYKNRESILCKRKLDRCNKEKAQKYIMSREINKDKYRLTEIKYDLSRKLNIDSELLIDLAILKFKQLTLVRKIKILKKG